MLTLNSHEYLVKFAIYIKDKEICEKEKELINLKKLESEIINLLSTNATNDTILTHFYLNLIDLISRYIRFYLFIYGFCNLSTGRCIDRIT